MAHHTASVTSQSDGPSSGDGNIAPAAGPVVAQALPFEVHIPFIQGWGCTLVQYQPGLARIDVQVVEGLTNSFGVGHGGMLMTLLDVAMAHAARAHRDSVHGGHGPGAELGKGREIGETREIDHVDQVDQMDPKNAAGVAIAQDPTSPPRRVPSGLVTIELKTNFLRPAQGHISAIGEVLHASATLAYTEGRILDEQGRLCAKASATFKFVRSLPIGARRAQEHDPNPNPNPDPDPDPDLEPSGVQVDDGP